MPPPIIAARAHAITYRAETDADFAFLRDLYASTRAAELAQSGWPLDAQRAFLDSQFAAQRAHYRTHYDAEWLVIERAAASIGRLYLRRFDTRHDIVDIALVDGARGHGLGSAIIADVMADAVVAGCPVQVHVESFNQAHALYQRLGFVTVESGGVYDRMMWTPPVVS